MGYDYYDTFKDYRAINFRIIRLRSVLRKNHTWNKNNEQDNQNIGLVLTLTEFQRQAY